MINWECFNVIISRKNIKDFRPVHKLSKENQPFHHFETEIDLQELNGVEMGRILHSTIVCVKWRNEEKKYIIIVYIYWRCWNELTFKFGFGLGRTWKTNDRMSIWFLAYGRLFLFAEHYFFNIWFLRHTTCVTVMLGCQIVVKNFVVKMFFHLL